jgi:pRiA4b ORF-3-like protein
MPVSQEATIYQLKVTLDGSKPPIWRRILVPATTTLGELHRILQVVMGWENYHLHQFVVGGRMYSDPTMEGMEDFGDLDEDEIVLGKAVPREGMKFKYKYDFGDSWDHTLLVEKRLSPTPGTSYPMCIKGKRTCPPEDCGGVWGYAAMLDSLADPSDPEYEHWREWVGDDFDPEAFDLDSINLRLRDLS